jgi:hypothetical protein
MKATIGFFQEKAGENSATRLIFVIGSIWAMGMSVYFAVHGTDPAVILAFFAGTEGSMAGLKLGQKAMEKKAEK